MATPTPCYHCGLPAKASEYTLQQGQDTLCFCCPGCRAVAQSIFEGGLGKYYQYRDGTAAQVDNDRQRADHTLYDKPEFQQGFVSEDDGGKSAELSIDGISCAACTWLIEQRLRSLDGVTNVHVNLAKHRALISWRPDQLPLSEIFQTVEDIGYTPYPYSRDHEEQRLEEENRNALKRLGVAGLGMMQVGMFAIALHAGTLQGISELHRDFLRLVSLVVATAVVFYAARPFFQSAARNLRNRTLGMDIPVSLAIGLSYAASCWATFTGQGDVYFDSVAMFTFFLLSSRYLEMRARHHSARVSEGLAALEAPYAWRLGEEGAPAEQVPISTLAAGDRILIKPGELIPADGMVLSGSSSIDESAFSGEFLPIGKQVGDSVTAGSINADGLLTVAVSAVGEHSGLAVLTGLLERAQASKPRSAWLADRLASAFVLLVLLSAAAAGAYWLWHEPQRALWVALSVLVVSCPCALSLATPTALTAALSALKQRGVLLSRSSMLEDLPKADAVVFDKTGTLTTGKLQLIRTHTYATLDRESCIALAAALEQHSNHPIASAFAAPGPALSPSASDIELHTGRGVSGCIAGVRYYIGSAAFVQVASACAPPAANDSPHPRAYLSRDGQLLAEFELDDPVRPSAPDAVAELRRQGLQIRMLSGDSSGAVPAIAESLGIEDYQGALSPEQKLIIINQWQARGERLIMVGDGINDVPVLAAADMSIAVVNATELAKASADCLLLSGDLKRISQTRQMAVKTRRIIKQNLGWALLYNLTAIPLAAAGFVPPWLAALGMSGSSLLVVANALRLR